MQHTSIYWNQGTGASLNFSLDQLAKYNEKMDICSKQVLICIEKLYKEEYCDERPDVVSYRAEL